MGAAATATNPWEARFRTLLKKDGYAERIFARLLTKGIRERRLVLLLQAAADPDIGSRLQRLIEEGGGRNGQSFGFPSKQTARHFTKNLRDTAAEIRRFWLHSFFAALPYSKRAVVTANLLDEQADALCEVRWNVITKRMGYKALWKQFPLALLCLELKVPEVISYVDLSQLLGVALRAHFRRDGNKSFSSDALRRQYERFYKRQTSRCGDLAFLEAFLKFVPPSD